MKIALDIGRLRLQGVRGATPEQVAAAIEAELGRLAQIYGLPNVEGKTLQLDLASFQVEPGMNGIEAGRNIARRLMSRWFQQAGAPRPPELLAAEKAAEPPIDVAGTDSAQNQPGESSEMPMAIEKTATDS